MAKKRQQYPNRKRNIIIGVVAAALVIAILAGIGIFNNMRKASIFTLDGVKTPTREYALYQFNQRINYEYQFGQDVWQYATGDKTFYDYARESALNSLLNTKVVAAHGKQLGVVMTDEDKAKAKESADTFLTNVAGTETDAFLKALDMTRAQLEAIMLESMITDKVYDIVTADYAFDEEAFQTDYDLYLQDSPEYYKTAHVNYIQIATISEAREIIAEMNGGKDFLTLMEEKSLKFDPEAEDIYATSDLSTLGVSAEVVREALTLEPGAISDFEEIEGGYIVYMLDNVEEPDYDELETWYRDNFANTKKQEIFTAQCDEWVAAADYVLNDYVYKNLAILGLEQYHGATVEPTATPAAE